MEYMVGNGAGFLTVHWFSLQFSFQQCSPSLISTGGWYNEPFMAKVPRDLASPHVKNGGVIQEQGNDFFSSLNWSGHIFLNMSSNFNLRVSDSTCTHIEGQQIRSVTLLTLLSLLMQATSLHWANGKKLLALIILKVTETLRRIFDFLTSSKHGMRML
jgi:hypothetical protein